VDSGEEYRTVFVMLGQMKEVSFCYLFSGFQKLMALLIREAFWLELLSDSGEVLPLVGYSKMREVVE